MVPRFGRANSDLRRLCETAENTQIHLLYIYSYNFLLIKTEAVFQRFSVKKVFLEISHNSQENICARVSFLTKLQASGLQLY